MAHRWGVPVAELGVVTRALLAIARDGQDDRRLAEQICRACVDGLDVDGASISMLTATASRETLWATDATAELLEDLQFTLNEGACMEAARSGTPVLVPDLRHSTELARWPVFAAAVAERTEVRALFALPLQWGAVNLGVLDLYRATGGLSRRAVARRDERRGHGRADAARAAHRSARRHRGLAGPLRGPPRRDPPGHRHGAGPARGQRDDALARLRAHAFASSGCSSTSPMTSLPAGCVHRGHG